MYPFMKKHKFPAAKIVLTLPLFPLISRFAVTFISVLTSNMINAEYQTSLVNLIIVGINSMVLYFIYCSMSFTEFKILNPVLDVKGKKVALSTTITH